MLSGSPRGRDGTSGHRAPPDSSSGVAAFVRRAVCTVFSLRSTTKVSGSGAHTAPEGGQSSQRLGWRMASLAHWKRQFVKEPAFRVGCARCLRRKQRPGALPQLQPSLRVRRSALYLVMIFAACACVRAKKGGVSERGHAHARSTAGPSRAAKWLVLQFGGGSGSR